MIRYLRRKSNIIGVVLLVIIFILTSCCHYKNLSDGRTRLRRSRWFIYDEYDDSPYVDRIIILPKNVTNGSIQLSDPTALPPSSVEIDINTSFYIDHSWASINQDFTAESTRFLKLIKTVQDDKHCSEKLVLDKSVCCLSEGLYEGIVYSFNLDQSADVSFEKKLLEYSEMNQIYIYNPNYSVDKRTHAENSQSFDRTNGETKDGIQNFNFFKVALDTQSSQSTNRRWRRKTLQEIKADLGHRKLNLVRINMNSSEWKVLRQWLETGEIIQIDQLIVKIHLHWSGFGVNGKNHEIVHQWYNTISSIIKNGLHLVSSVPGDGPKVFLSQNDLFDTSCCYYLTFFRK